MHHLKKTVFVYFLTCLSIIFISSPKIWADANVSSNITTDTTWTKANSPYIVTGTVQVYPDVTLTIEPGVTVKFNSGAGLTIGHKLIAIGNEYEPIIFTSNVSPPTVYDWTGIGFVNAMDAIFDENGNYVDGSIIKYCVIEYSYGILISSSSPYIASNKIQHNWMYPHGNNNCHGSISLYLSNSIISDNEISDNEVSPGGALICARYSSPTIFNNYITNNTNGSSIALYEHNEAIIANNEIVSNNSGGTVSVGNSTSEIRGNIIDTTVLIFSNSTANIQWNDLYPDGVYSPYSVYFNSTISTNAVIHNNNLIGVTLGPYDFEVDATDNYWGTTNTATIDANITDYYDDFTLGKVNYQPIRSTPVKKVDFSAVPLSGNFPLQVAFSNNSMGIINSVTWDFGDGETSNEMNPVHVYKSAGTFNVGLMVIGRTEEITETKSNYITVDTPNYTLSFSGSGNGSVKVNGILHALPWSGQFPSGTDVQIEAVDDSGWSFTNWTGDYTGSTNPTTVNMSGNKNITANFSQNCDYSLTVNINPSGSGTVTKSPDKANYCPNEQVILTTSPNSGHTFSSWEGVDSSNGTTASITINENRTVTANFTQQILNEPDISVDPVTQEFGNIPVGDSSMPQTLTISNTGTGNLIMGTLSIIGNDASQFIKQDDTCSGQTLTPSANCTVKAMFSPTSIGSFNAILNIPSNDADEPAVTVSLKGGSGADITGAWTSLVQQCSKNKCKINGKFNVQNIGNRDSVPSLVRFYLSDDGVYDGGDSFLKEIKTGTLKTSKSKNMSLSYSFQSGVSATDKYIIAVMDEYNTVSEANESNNVIVYGPILRANLTGMWTSLIQQCKGEKCKIKGALNIQNIGYQDAASFVRSIFKIMLPMMEETCF